MRILVTGAAGFIGAATSRALLDAGHEVTGIDNLNGYYEPALKVARLATLAPFRDFQFKRIDLADRRAMEDAFLAGSFHRVVHLGAQAGVRQSIVLHGLIPYSTRAIRAKRRAVRHGVSTRSEAEHPCP